MPSRIQTNLLVQQASITVRPSATYTHLTVNLPTYPVSLFHDSTAALQSIDNTLATTPPCCRNRRLTASLRQHRCAVITVNKDIIIDQNICRQLHAYDWILIKQSSAPKS